MNILFAKFSLFLAALAIAGCATSEPVNFYHMTYPRDETIADSEVLKNKVSLGRVTTPDDKQYSYFSRAVADWLERYNLISASLTESDYVLDVDLEKHGSTFGDTDLWQAKINYRLRSQIDDRVVLERTKTTKYSLDQVIDDGGQIRKSASNESALVVAEFLLFGLAATRPVTSGPANQRMKLADDEAAALAIRYNLQEFIHELMIAEIPG